MFFCTPPHALFNTCVLSPSPAISCILVLSFSLFSSPGHPACVHNLCCFGALERWSGNLCVGQGACVWLMWFRSYNGSAGLMVRLDLQGLFQPWWFWFYDARSCLPESGVGFLVCWLWVLSIWPSQGGWCDVGEFAQCLLELWGCFWCPTIPRSYIVNNTAVAQS